jgi:chromosome segregation ATPase
MEACLSIVLHQFTAWGGYNKNNNYQGQKYHVQRILKGAKDDLDEIRKRKEERQKKIQRKQEELEEMEKEDGGLTGFLPRFMGEKNDKNDGDY